MVSTWGDLLDQMVNKQINGKIEENFGREVETEEGGGEKKCSPVAFTQSETYSR